MSDTTYCIVYSMTRWQFICLDYKKKWFFFYWQFFLKYQLRSTGLIFPFNHNTATTVWTSLLPMKSMHFINHPKPLRTTELLPLPKHYDIQNAAKRRRKNNVWQIFSWGVCTCVNWEQQKAPTVWRLVTVPEQGVFENVIAQGSPLSLSLSNLFHLPRERGRKEKNKQLHHAFRVFAALAARVDSLQSALAQTGHGGLMIWLNWNAIQYVNVCDMQVSQPGQTHRLHVERAGV